MHGKFALIAPISTPGVVLSQPPINTAASTGCARNISSVCIANKLRNIIADGFISCSPNDNAGSSAATPPARKIPRLMSPTRSGKCV